MSWEQEVEEYQSLTPLLSPLSRPYGRADFGLEATKKPYMPIFTTLGSSTG
jgi:hypothetical protein